MNITNELNLPQPFVSAVNREYSYKPKRYSATAVLKGTCESILQRRHDDEIDSDVADMIWLIFGTAVHSVLENAEETKTQLKENKVEMEMDNGYTLSGIFDLYDDATGTVTDYKTATVWKVINNDWEDYRRQLLIYCVLLQSIGFDAWRGEIVAVLKDHSKTKAATDSSYPQFPVHREEWAFTNDQIDDMRECLNEKFREIERCEQLPDEQLPMCTEEERWHKPDTWAVVKDGNKRAYRVFDDEALAEKVAAEQGEKTGKPHHVEFRKGEDVKCAKYCAARDFCPHVKSGKVG